MLNAIDIPARQAMLAEMIPKQYLTSAIALNSTTSNSSRVIGPAFAGALIAIVGTGYTFLLNSASYLAAIVAIALIHYEQKLNPDRPHPFSAIREGISYTFSHPVIRTCLLAMTTVALFGYSYSSIVPAIATHVFHGTSSTLGYLLATSGLGSVIAGILIAARASQWGEVRFAAVASSVLSVSFFVYAFTDQLFVGLIISLLLGLTLTGTSSTLTTLVQHRVDEAIRGRVISVILISFTAAMALGSFAMGYTADHLGYRATLLGSAIGAAGVAIFLTLSYRRSKTAASRGTI
jgi:predicted MFS family arabinose efflux permease